MNPELEQLVQLQAIDLQIKELTCQHDDIPRQTESLEIEVSRAERNLEEILGATERLRKQRRVLEDDVELLRAKLSRYKEQLMSVKTNKEYTAMLHEIDGCSKEISSKEDEVLAIMEQMEAHERTIEEEQQAFALRQEWFKKRQAEVQQHAAALAAQMQSLQQDRNRVLAGISETLLNLYGRIADARKGVAVAEVRNQSCQVCHVRLRPQMFNEIKKNERIITCESCNRILYYAAGAS
ncbi:MAG: hypothetical protein HYX74_00135 [Acidobacteria bacterium]|nr:hypothetical protein [Acidobacteriota bacterium]